MKRKIEMIPKRGDVVKVIYDYNHFAHGIFLSGMTVIIHDIGHMLVDSITNIYFNIGEKTDKEYEEILQIYPRWNPAMTKIGKIESKL